MGYSGWGPHDRDYELNKSIIINDIGWVIESALSFSCLERQRPLSVP